MNSTTSRVRSAIVFFAVIVPMALGVAGRAYADATVADTDKTIALYKKTDPGIAAFFANAAGYAVFPGIGKGGFGVGGAHGTGILYENGKATAKTTVNQLSVGLQAGGQAFSEVIFFQTEESLANFKGSNFAFSAQASAVALKTGAAAAAKYREGVAVFTAAKGGLMFEASLGGQKFKYEPFVPQN